jgi:single-stranded-DNA-specific exonuclease
VREIALREAGANGDGAGGARRLPRVVVAAADHLEYGLIGLVAGRLADELKRPVFVISRNGEESRGSGRGPAGMDLGKLLAARPELFKRFGGHAQAAGFTIATEDLPELKRYLSGVVPEEAAVDGAGAGAAEAAAEAAADGHIAHGALAVDCVLPLRRLVRENQEAVRLLEPFGVGFPEPVFVAKQVTIERCWPSGPEGRTLRLRLRDGAVTRTAMWPRHGHLWIEIERARPTLRAVDVVYTLAAPGRGGDDSVPRVVALVAGERA